ncbi:MAG: PAS domain S-box protein [candidate division KSB1 bacterium]|nr:PAS domain S-box protein [candidate division KSB1 bacterium]MDZ7345685.1 PAS domain S-box protein [candidate division KSB1 bacterium]
MNILIAHPKQAFIDAASESFGLRRAGHQIASAHSLADLVDKIAQNSYHLLLIDGELIDNGAAAFFGVLSALKDEADVIVTVDEKHAALQQELKELGGLQIVVKTDGYLTALNRAIRRILEKAAQAAVNSTLQSEPAGTQSASEERSFVCDRRGRFLSVAEGIERLTGYAAEELAHLSLTDLMPAGQEASFYRRLFDETGGAGERTLTIDLRDKFGKVHSVELIVRLISVEGRPDQFIGFRGTMREVEPSVVSREPARIDQMEMIAQFIELVHDGYSQPLSLFLRRIVEVTCQLFRFRRSTLALLDTRSQSFIKQALVGYSEAERQQVEQRVPEVPRDVIDRIFEGRYRIKVIYHQRRERDTVGDEAALLPDRRSQRRPAVNQWHKRDLVLLNLKDHSGVTFGYISLDEPQPDMQPNRNLFYNLEIFSRLISMAIENYYRFSTLAKRNRRLQQILANSSIFKLQPSLTDVLNETSWAAKNTLEFNLICIALINKKSQKLELKSVACDDAVKQAQLLELAYEVPAFSRLLKDEYQLGKSYYIKKEEAILRHLKQIYYGAELSLNRAAGWNPWQFIVVPIRGREEKIIGFLMADDPVSHRAVPDETIGLLEIIAGQVAVAIENRMLYVEVRDRRIPISVSDTPAIVAETHTKEFEEEAPKGIKRLVDRFLR